MIDASVQIAMRKELHRFSLELLDQRDWFL